MTEAPAEPFEMANGEYDLVIVGGGIYGAALCWQAVCLGLRVAVYERADFASGASSNSLKTVHGGVRYLQTMNLPRTLKSIRERNRLLQWFGHNVAPLQCVMPTQWRSIKNPIAVLLGFGFFSVLSRVLNRRVPAAVHRVGLMSVQADLPVSYAESPALAYWHDAQALLPERLVIDMLTSAVAKGAQVVNYCAVEAVESDVAGLVVRTDAGIVRARMLADCSGGWRWQSGLTSTRYVRAVNLVLDRPWGQIAGTLEGAQAGDRFLFACPWQDLTMIGTWYFYQHGHVDQNVSEAEIEAMLAEVNERVVTPFKRSELINLHVGLLPLGTDPGNEPELGNALTDVVAVRQQADQPIFRVEGIKFTTAVADAGIALQQMLTQARPGRAKVSPAPQAPVCQLTDTGQRARWQAQHAWCPPLTLARLITVYGAAAGAILERAQREPSLAQALPGAPQTLVAEVDHCVAVEFVSRPADFLLRRSGLAAGRPPQAETVTAVCQRIGYLLGWTDTEAVDHAQQFWQSHPLWGQLQPARPAHT